MECWDSHTCWTWCYCFMGTGVLEFPITRQMYSMIDAQLSIKKASTVQRVPGCQRLKGRYSIVYRFCKIKSKTSFSSENILLCFSVYWQRSIKVWIAITTCLLLTIIVTTINSATIISSLCDMRRDQSEIQHSTCRPVSKWSQVSCITHIIPFAAWWLRAMHGAFEIELTYYLV